MALMVLWNTGIAILLSAYARATRTNGAEHAGPLPWWAWFAIVPLGLVCAVIGAMVLNVLFQAVEWLAFALRRCPRCGKRRWSWGFTRGFGL